MLITPLEANLLLFALDEYLGVDADGIIIGMEDGYTREAVQDLRDRLMAAHEHPET